MKKIAIKEKEGNALIIIDAQNDFVYPGGALYVAGIEGELSPLDILIRIDNLAHKPFDYLTITEDRHPKNQHIEYKIFGGKHCVAGTRGQKYCDSLAGRYNNADEKLEKGMNPNIVSYSIMVSPQFAKHIGNLRRKEIRRIFVAGWAYTHCVGESAIAYATQGFETFVVRDATRSVPPPYGDPKKMDKKLQLYGVKRILYRYIK